jgi:hypothetical protein
MEKAYVILKKGFEYDDNIYNELEGGTPDLIVFSKEDAIEKIKLLNINEYKENSLQNYCYNINDVLDVDLEKYKDFNKSLDEKYGKPEEKNKWYSFEYKLHPMANKEEAEKYADMVGITFYEMIETDIDLKSYRDEKLKKILN